MKCPGETGQALFCPEATFWRVNRELLVGLAGSRALLMELAHPLVAAAVASHSHFQGHPLGRLYRTARAMTDITFGTTERALKAAGQINRCHQRVHGTLPESVGSLPQGTYYQANDPLLKLWVLATLIDSSLLVYDRFVRPLSQTQREDYYRDSRWLARLLGIPPGIMPASYEDFAVYMETMLASDLLTVGDTARELAKALFAPTILGRLTFAAGFVGIGLLPERLRRTYGFSWDDQRERRLHRLAKLSGRIRALLPSVLCVSPRALIAQRHNPHQHVCSS